MKHLKLKIKEIGPLGELVFGQINNLLEKECHYWIGETAYTGEKQFETIIVDKIKEADAFIAEENFDGKKLGIQVVIMPEWTQQNLGVIAEKLQSFNVAAIELELEQKILENRELHLIIQPSEIDEDYECIIFELYSFPKNND